MVFDVKILTPAWFLCSIKKSSNQEKMELKNQEEVMDFGSWNSQGPLLSHLID